MYARLPTLLSALLGVLALAGCSAQDPPTQTPVYHTGTPTNRSSVNSWELGQSPSYSQPGVYGGKPVHLTPLASQRGFEPDDPAAQAVLAALNRDGVVSTQYLTATGHGGIVVLVGSVVSPAQKARAAQIARAAPGVRELRDRVAVLSP